MKYHAMRSDKKISIEIKKGEDADMVSRYFSTE